MTTKRIKLKNADGDYLEPYTTNVPDASSSVKGLVQTETTPTANQTILPIPTSLGSIEQILSVNVENLLVMPDNYQMSDDGR